MELTPEELLALLPLGTAMVLGARLVLGVRTTGAFAPALLSLTILQIGVQQSLAGLLVAGGAGLVAAPIVDRLSVPRSSRLAVMVVVVCAALVATGVLGETTQAFPIVVLAILVERTWDSALVDGPSGAAGLFVATSGTAFVVAAALSEVAPVALGHHWLPTAATGVTLNLLVGRYRGLRLSERTRFATVLDDGPSSFAGVR